MVPAIAAMISTASKTTANLSDAKNSKTELRCQAGWLDEFEFAMRRRHFPRGAAVLQLVKAFGVNRRIFLRSRERLRVAHASRVLASVSSRSRTFLMNLYRPKSRKYTTKDRFGATPSRRGDRYPKRLNSVPDSQLQLSASTPSSASGSASRTGPRRFF